MTQIYYDQNGECTLNAIKTIKIGRTMGATHRTYHAKPLSVIITINFTSKNLKKPKHHA